MSFNYKRILAVFLAMLMLMSSVAFGEGFSAIVSSSRMPVYSSSDLFEQLGTLSKNTIVTVLSAEDGVAKFSYKNRTAYASVEDLKAVADVATAASVRFNTRVYASASTKAKSAKIEQGTVVNLLGTQGVWAAIERDGNLGFIQSNALSTGSTQTPSTGNSANDVVSCDFDAAVAVNKLTVYESASTGAAKLGTLKKGTLVHVHSYNKTWAYIDVDGHYGYVKHSGLTRDLPQATATPAPTATPAAGNNDGEVVMCNFQAAVAVDKLTVYAAASTSAEKLGSMKKGTVVTVLGYNKTWAYIDLDGHYGHVKHAGLTKDLPQATATPTPTPAPTATPAPNYNSNSQYSNEEIVFAFLINECDFNTAAACGVLANIRAESNFRPEALNSIGCYGICQWYKGRRTRLNNFCEENGYDSASLEGQLWYLKYELQEHYKGTWNYLRGVENTAQGAYAAAYYWCYYFEVPENRTSNSQKRGASARDTYWPKYAK